MIQTASDLVCYACNRLGKDEDAKIATVLQVAMILLECERRAQQAAVRGREEGR